ncbi:MAG: hypothetical protein KH380_04320 [Coprobacillus sp.]|nr:hypothetical protein [Coprobacillus sp.]
MERKKIRKGIIISLLSILCVGITFSIANKREITQPNEEITIIQKGLKVRRLTANDNTYGEKDEVFSYSFTPYNATNQSVEGLLKYIDGTDCSAVMCFSIDESNHLITLSCKKPFSQQIHFILTSKANSKAQATIVLDYVKKIKSLSVKKNNFAVVNDYKEWSNSSYRRIEDFKRSNFYDVIYTEFTKTNGTFDFNMKIQAIAMIENTTYLSTTYTDTFTKYLNLKLSNITDTNYDSFTSSDLWKMALTNGDKSALKMITKEDVNKGQGYLKYNISVIISSANGSKSAKGFISLTYFMYGNYLGEVGVDSLESEIISISF